MRIVHVTADNNYALFYQCSGLRTDNTCSAITIDVAGRAVGPIADEIKAELETYTEKLCVTMDDFHKIVHEGIKKSKNSETGNGDSRSVNS